MKNQKSERDPLEKLYEFFHSLTTTGKTLEEFLNEVQNFKGNDDEVIHHATEFYDEVSEYGGDGEI